MVLEFLSKYMIGLHKKQQRVHCPWPVHAASLYTTEIRGFPL